MEKIKFKDLIKNIIAYETFENMSNFQVFENIKIDLNVPISEIFFNAEDTKIALQVLTIKTLAGFNNPSDDYDFYINNEKIEKEDLLLFNDDPFDYIESFIEKYKEKIKEKNSIKIEFLNPNNFDYVKYIKIEKPKI